MPLLYGLHDREALPAVPNDGWCLDTIALSEHPAPVAYDPRVNWIVRANWGYGSTGTIPLLGQYQAFADAVADYVFHSTNLTWVIIGNEPNHENERPNGVLITPAQYVACFVKCRDAIKRANPNVQVLPAPCAPYHANPVNWLDYLSEMLRLVVANGGCDGIAVHAYTRSSDPADIPTTAKMGGVLAGQYSGFYTYRDALAEVPADLLHLPAFITEFDELLAGGWRNANTGVVQAAYADINAWNTQNHTPKIHALVLYRWPQYDEWHIEGKQGVIDDFQAAVGRGYLSPSLNTRTVPEKPREQVSMPEIKAPAPTLPPRDIDPRAAARGTQIEPVSVAPGQQFWRVKRLYTPNEADSDKLGPDHHILANVLIDGQRQVGTPLLVTWGGGGPNEQAAIHTKKNDPFAYSADFPMSPGPFTLAVNDGKPSEKVVGIKMGEQTEQGFNPGIHESTLVDFELTTMPSVAQPSRPQQPAQVPQLVHPIQDPAKRIVSQPFGAKDEDYSKFGLAGHNGIDFAVPEGTPVVAVDDGQVVEAQFDEGGYGTYVKIRHSWGESLYAHLNNRVTDLRAVSKGELIGLSGNTGNSTGPHLHFGLRVNPYQRGYPYDGYSDPAPYLSGASTPAQKPITQVGLTPKGTIYAASVVHGIDYALLASFAWAESSWRADAVSSAGALGILQLMPDTWAEWSKRVDPPANDPLNDAQNLEVGIAYFKWLLTQTHGDTWQALVAWNWGIGNVLSGATAPAESAEFANKVIHGRDLLNAIGVTS